MSSIRFKMTGLDALAKRLGVVREEVRKAVTVGVRAVAENVRTNSMRRTPVDLGTLRASHFIDEVGEVGDTIFTTVSVGGGAAEDYAVIQHERLDFHHDEGEAKFLESARNEELPNAAPLIAKFTAEAIRRAARGGGRVS